MEIDSKDMRSIKKEPDTTRYQLLYWPTIPGRGEFVRLAFELTGTPYEDICNEHNDGIKEMTRLISSTDSAIYPLFAPPVLRVLNANGIDKPLVLHQTPNILIYLASKLGLDGGVDEADQLNARQIMLTALDLNNEAHDTHHPVAVSEYYEDQKNEALRRAEDFRQNRIPKFLSYFERALLTNERIGQGRYFVGDRSSIADIAVWQVVDGLKFAFPKEMSARESNYPLLNETFYGSFAQQPAIKEYLASSRRQKYSSGIFRHYPELDRQE